MFEKRSDGYFLTLAGERVLPTLKALEEGILSVERLIAGQEERIEGIVKIAMPGALANHWLIPKLQPFVQKHSQIKFEFLTGPEVVNLSRREADLAIRLVRPTQRDLVVKKFGEIQLSLYGHPSLFTSTRRPATKEDLKKFPFIGLFPNSMSELEKQLWEVLGSNRVFVPRISWCTNPNAVRTPHMLLILLRSLSLRNSLMSRKFASNTLKKDFRSLKSQSFSMCPNL